ncbi:MAG: hypothetical protein ABIW85_10010 [Variovorax sp.]
MIYDATIQPLPLAAMVDLKGPREDVLPRLARLGLAAPLPGRATRAGSFEACQPGREHWLVRAPLEQEQTLLALLLQDAPASATLIVLVSDMYADFSIAGPDARQILAIACPLDADPVAFPPDGATFTEAFGQRVLLLRREDGFELAVERSYAPMMADYFARIQAVDGTNAA